MVPHVGLQIAPAAQIALAQSLTPGPDAVVVAVLVEQRLDRFSGLSIGDRRMLTGVVEVLVDDLANVERVGQDAVEMTATNPRTACFCQPLDFTSASSVH
jgi:hypothetical protein